MKYQERAAQKFNAPVTRERDLRLWWKCMGGLAIGIFMVGGFSIAAQQHFTAYQYSVRNVELQRERNRLRNEQNRLMLEREAALAPAQLEKKAFKIGMKTLTAEQINELPREIEASNNAEKSF